MVHLEQYFNHLVHWEQSAEFGFEPGHNLFLIGALLSKRPKAVLELGVGLGCVTKSLLYALKHNQCGQLTCVRDWQLWDGREHPDIAELRAAGAKVTAPLDRKTFLTCCRSDTYDAIVSDTAGLEEVVPVAEYLRIAVDDALLFFHTGYTEENPTDLRVIRNYLSERGLFYLYFGQDGRRKPKSDRELLLVINDKRKAEQRCRTVGIVSETMRQPGHLGSMPAKSARQSRHSSQTLYLGLLSGKNYGWGICSDYLIRELSKLIKCHVINEQDGTAQNPQLDGKLFQALTSVDFFAMFEHARAEQNFGYTFFENELTDHSIANAKKYDLILAGSTWCRDRMVEKGIKNCDVLIQGIDPQCFFPISEEKDDGTFVIFSGGKFELRKGQDLVLKAVKILQQKYPDVILINCWFNKWPESMKLMGRSQHIRFEYVDRPWPELMQSTYARNGLDAGRIVTLELIPYEIQREIFKRTDIGVFPNRCEGGTNLVMMEYMACGKPVIASNCSGHKDIVTERNAMLLNDLRDLNVVDPCNRLIARWQEPSLEELVAKLEDAYLHRDEGQRIGKQAGEDLKRFTWQESARRLLQLLDIRL